MRKWLLCLCLTISVMTYGQALKKADEAQSKAIIEKINHTASAVRSISCDFMQVKSLRFLNDKMTSQGKMWYDGSGKLRWEYMAPYKYIFVLNGQSVYIKSAKSSQTIDIRQSRLFQNIARLMMNSVTGKCLAADDDFVCEIYVQGEEWIASLTPKKKEIKKMFKGVKLHFDNARQMVSQVELTETSGDTTIITLNNIKLNERLDEKLFSVH